MTSIDVRIEGARELGRQLRKLGGPALRRVGKDVTRTAMRPVLELARATAPVGPTGRLRASLGTLVQARMRAGAFTTRVGTRRDFRYVNTSGDKMVSGRGKIRDRAIKSGYAQDDKTAQQYARLIEFGYDKKGRMRRRAGGAHFLDNSLVSQRSAVIGTVSSELRRYVENPPTP